MGRFNWGREGPPEEAYSKVTVDPEGGRVVTPLLREPASKVGPCPAMAKRGRRGNCPR